MDFPLKKSLINGKDELAITSQCILLGLSRSSIYYKSVPEYSEKDFKILKEIDKIYTDNPFYGHRRIYLDLLDLGYKIGRDRVLCYMQNLGLTPIYPKPKTSLRDKGHKVYPYLLKEIEVLKPNQVWCSDITYISVVGGFCYMVAIMDLYSRKILSYRISNTMDKSFCIEALEEALIKYGRPEIFNTDQGCQFTSKEFTEILIKNGIQISMDSKGRALDNIFIERFWRTIKYENIYIYNYRTLKETKVGINRYVTFYNTKRKHYSLNKQTPYHYYYCNLGEREAA